MFRPLRRPNQALSEAACREIIARHTDGVLAVHGDDGYPYTVPLNYYYDGSKLVFHGAQDGHKWDAFRRNPKASFCIVDKNDVHAEEFTTYFQSVVLFGKIRPLEDETEKRELAFALGRHYVPHDEAAVAAYIERFIRHAGFFVLEIEHISGKIATELQ